MTKAGEYATCRGCKAKLLVGRQTIGSTSANGCPQRKLLSLSDDGVYSGGTGWVCNKCWKEIKKDVDWRNDKK